MKDRTDYANLVSKAFIIFPGPKSRKQVMARFLTNLNINVNTPDNVLFTRLAIAQKEVLAIMNMSLE
jgi:hypothetical protein